MKQYLARVLDNRPIARDIFLLTLEAPPDAETLPGQFLHIAPGDGAHILRRPISIMRAEGGAHELAIQHKGEGTRLLSRLSPGSVADVVGPIGRGFTPGDARRVYCVGGGVGVGPVHFAMRAFAPGRVVEAFFGYRAAEFVYGAQDLPGEVHIATQDGSLGARGLVTDALTARMDECPPDLILACGPKPMLRAVQAVAKARGVRCQLSLEERMGCGVGGCLTCNVKIHTRDGWAYKRACVDGPVFDAAEVIFDGD